jgi:hypothetical protein
MLSSRETHALALGYAPPKAPAPRPLGTYVARLLDEAHHELAAHELAGLLLRVRGALWHASGNVTGSGPSAVAAHYLAVIVAALGEAGASAELRAWLDEYVEDVAVRPRGAAPPIG